MKLVASLFRISTTWLVMTAMLMGTLGIVITTNAEGASLTTYITTARVNVRVGASTATETLTTLDKGVVVLATGNVAKQWLPIKFNDKTAYLFADYVKKSTSKNPAVIGLAGKKTTTANVNQRDAASLTSNIIKVINKGTTVSVTGRSSGDFTEIKDGSIIRWLYTKYLGQEVDTIPVTPANGNATTTATLTLRKTAAATAASLGEIGSGATLALTGKHEKSYSEVVYNKQTGWILTGYFKAIAGSSLVSKLPVATGKVYINATGVNMRAQADVESAKVTTLSIGVELVTTGVVKNKYKSVIYDGQIRWVYDEYLDTKPIDTSKDLGSSSLNRLEKYGKAAVLEVRENFPEITSIGGWRSSSSYSSDHPNGRAIDIMLPNYKKNKALGDKIADWVIKNGKRMHVSYLIWYQRNYRISRGAWTKMSDRGSDNQNHKNHVHVSFEPS